MAYRFFDLTLPDREETALALFDWLQNVAQWDMEYAATYVEGTAVEVTDWGETDATDLASVVSVAVFSYPDAALSASGVRILVQFDGVSILTLTPLQMPNPAETSFAAGIPVSGVLDLGEASVDLETGSRLLVHTTPSSVLLVGVDVADFQDLAWGGYLRSSIRSTLNPTVALGSGDDPYPGAVFGAPTGEPFDGKVVDEYSTAPTFIFPVASALYDSAVSQLTPIEWQGSVPRQPLQALAVLEELDGGAFRARGYVSGVYKTSSTTPGILRDVQTGNQYYVLGEYAGESDTGIAVGPL